MTMEFEFYNIVNDKFTRKLIRSIKYPLVYRIYHKSLNINYIGSTKSLYSRLFGKWGYIRIVSIKEGMCPIHRALDKYGYQDFVFIVENFTDTIDEAKNLEEFYITKYDSFFNGYNETPDGKGGKMNVTYITDGINDKRVSNKWLTKFNNTLPEGWKFGRTSKPNKNKIHVNNGTELRYIYEYELHEFLSRGYVIGTLNKPSKGRIVMNNGVQDKFVKPEDEELYKSLGYTRGGLKGVQNRMKIWINNGVRNTKINYDELDKYLSENWVRGRLTIRHN